MLFTITSEVLIYDDKEDKYYVKQRKCQDGKIILYNFSEVKYNARGNKNKTAKGM